MKEIFTLRVQGDDDVIINYQNCPVDCLNLYFTSFDVAKFIEIIKSISFTPVPNKTGYVTIMENYIKLMIEFLNNYNIENIQFFYEKSFGGNQYITLSSSYIPEEADYVF